MATPSSVTFAGLLRHHRSAAGLTQEELAERARVSVDAVSTLERGARLLPRLDTVERLADGLGLQDDDRAAFIASARAGRSHPAATGRSSLQSSDPSRLAGLTHNLPIQPTPLLGRERELADLCALLRRDDVRLLTLTGSGGVGKTRLSLQVAAEVLDTFPDGVWNVRLSRLSDPSLVVSTIAAALELKESGAVPLVEVLRNHLQDKHLLLVLDNFEQVVEAAPSVGDLLEHAPGLKLLVTSRVPLHLRGERRVPISSLELPDPRQPATPEQLAQSAAVALFVERAREALPDFELSNDNGAAIAEICARLDGVPLAIELAAVRVNVLPPLALRKHLEPALPLLTDGPRDLEQRQQTMRNTLAWSYDLLTAEEQRLLRRLAVFVGGCTLEAAEVVCAAPEGTQPLGSDVLTGLSALVDHSLVQQRTEGEDGSEPRFSMLYVIREYALEQLEASGEAEALRRAHAAYYAGLAEQWWGTAYGAPADSVAAAANDMAALDAGAHRLVEDLDNMRATLGWLRTRAVPASRPADLSSPHTMQTMQTMQTMPQATPPVPQLGLGSGTAQMIGMGLRLARALLWVWIDYGHLAEGRAWLETFVALDPDAPGALDPDTPGGSVDVRAWALFALGLVAYWQGDIDEAVPPLRRSLALARAAGVRSVTSTVLNNLGMALQAQSEREQARACYAEGLALERALSGGGDLRGPRAGNLLSNLAHLVFASDELDQAEMYAEQAIAVCRAANYHSVVARSLFLVALIAWRRADLHRAVALAGEALALCPTYGDVRLVADGLAAYAIIQAALGHAEQAARVLGAAAAFRERIGMRRAIGLPVDMTGATASAVAGARAALGEVTWTAAFAAGQRLLPEEAIAEALGGGAA